MWRYYEDSFITYTAITNRKECSQMKEIVCSFCGHRDCYSGLREQIRAEIKDIIASIGLYGK